MVGLLLTHCNAVQRHKIRHGVIAIDLLPSELHCGLDCRMERLLRVRVEVVIQLIHGGDHGCNACRVLREEEGCFFVLL